MPYGNNMNIWRQTHSRCSFINRQFPLRWTGNTLSGKSGHSTLRISHSNWVQDVANELLHGGFTYLFIKFKLFYLKEWLIWLPAVTSAWIFKDTLRNHTQKLLKYIDSIIEICLHLINLNCTSDSYISWMLSSGAGTSNEIPLQESGFALPAILITLPVFTYWNQLLQ